MGSAGLQRRRSSRALRKNAGDAGCTSDPWRRVVGEPGIIGKCDRIRKATAEFGEQRITIHIEPGAIPKRVPFSGICPFVNLDSSASTSYSRWNEMSESPNTSYIQEREVPRALATTILCLQSAVLLGALLSFWGWVADRQRLTDWYNNGISIQPNATIAAMFAALALILLSRSYRRAATTVGVLVAFIGASVLFEYSSGIDLGIDSLLLFGRTWGRVGVLVPGRMGPMGAMSWTIIGVSVVLAARQKGSAARRLAPLLCLLTVGLSGLSLIGYLYSASSLYAVPTVTIIAMQTATFIFAASAALIMSVPESGPMRVFSEPSPAGILARRVLPVLIVVPILLGFFRLAGERAGLYDTAFGSALRTLSEIALFLFVLWRTTLAIDRQALQRQMADKALQLTQQQFKKEREEAFQREHAARSEAERAVRLKDEFFATVSHDLLKNLK
jgi:hypothetical protein